MVASIFDFELVLEPLGLALLGTFRSARPSARPVGLPWGPWGSRPSARPVGARRAPVGARGAPVGVYKQRFI